MGVGGSGKGSREGAGTAEPLNKGHRRSAGGGGGGGGAATVNLHTGTMKNHIFMYIKLT